MRYTILVVKLYRVKVDNGAIRTCYRSADFRFRNACMTPGGLKNMVQLVTLEKELCTDEDAHVTRIVYYLSLRIPVKVWKKGNKA